MADRNINMNYLTSTPCFVYVYHLEEQEQSHGTMLEATVGRKILYPCLICEKSMASKEGINRMFQLQTRAVRKLVKGIKLLVTFEIPAAV